METTNNATNETQKERQPYRVVVKQFADFDITGEMMITTTKQLSTAINAIITPAFADYFGCNLVPTQVNGIGVVIPYLYFKILPDDQYQNGKHYAFRTVKSQSTTLRMLDKITRMTNPNVSAMNTSVMITEDAKDVFEDFIPTYGRKRVDWDNNYMVKQCGMQGDVYAYIKNVDIIPIVKAIYGSRDMEGKPCEYNIVPVAPVTQNMQMNPNTMVFGNQYGVPYATPQSTMPVNVILNILRLNTGALARASEAVGYVANNNNPFPVIPAVRED